LPATLKLENGVGKQLLRQLARKRLPEEVTGAPKRGFSIDLAAWMRGELRDYVHGRVSSLSPLLAGRLAPASVQRLWNEHQSRTRDHSAVLWNLLVVSLWDARR
jgi:asparagine synthase (glutamine-hydrolysing)